MAARNLQSENTTSQSVVQWIGPGLIAGMVFAMWAMVVGAFTSTLWAPPQGIAQAVGIGAPGHEFQALPFVLGIMGHMLNTVILGALFVGIARAFRVEGSGLVMLGMAYGLIVYAVLYLVVFPFALPATSLSFVTANPAWSWLLGHLMFGMVLGGLVAFGPLRFRTGISPIRRVTVPHAA